MKPRSRMSLHFGSKIASVHVAENAELCLTASQVEPNQ